jgi:transcriptional regulator with XRE-family HTH domain
MGMHKLTAKDAAELLGLSQSVLSKWQSGARQPSFTSALGAGDFFGVPADRLARADFEDLLVNELADPMRFQAVEARIHHVRTGLQAVPSRSKPVTVGTLSDLTSSSTTVPKRKGTKERKES